MNEKWNNQKTYALIQAILALQNANEARKFLRDLLTEKEIIAAKPVATKGKTETAEIKKEAPKADVKKEKPAEVAKKEHTIAPKQETVTHHEKEFPKDKAEQRYIVKYLDSLRSKAEELRMLQDETGAELATFTPALLAKAFRGEL